MLIKDKTYNKTSRKRTIRKKINRKRTSRKRTSRKRTIKKKINRKRNNKKRTTRKKTSKKIKQIGGNNIEIVHVSSLKEYTTSVVTYGLVSCISIFWHCNGKNYLVHSSELQEETGDTAYHESLFKMRELELKDAKVYVYVGTMFLEVTEFEEYTENNNIEVIKMYYYDESFIGLTEDGLLIDVEFGDETKKKKELWEIKHAEIGNKIGLKNAPQDDRVLQCEEEFIKTAKEELLQVIEEGNK